MDLFKPLPPAFDLAVIHRFHTYLPGWEIPASNSSLLTNRYGFITDYVAEAFRLRKLGYSIVLSEVRDAQNCGVPQRRRRLILIASRVGKFEIKEPKTTKTTVREAISYLPTAGTSGDPLHDLPEKRIPKVMAMIRDIPKDGGSRGDLPAGRARLRRSGQA